jgi:HD superfamily phosphohydrolase
MDSASKSVYFKDSVYEFIDLPALCVEYLDQPEFQRLRRVRQLGNSHRVFTSATHTRFSHSLGVMYLAGIMCKQLKIKDKRTKHLIQLAGMHHDIGHLPYSHLFDRVLEIAKPLGVSLHHEVRSCEIFIKVSERLGLLTDQEVKFVCACITETCLEGYPKYYFKIISGPVDVDKLDYLHRDAYHIGLPEFQAQYIVKNSLVGSNGDLAFRTKAKGAIIDMFAARKRMHDVVYQHKVCLEYDTLYMCMILKVIGEMDKAEIENLCDYALEHILMTHPETKATYLDLERRVKTHSKTCTSHPIIEKQYYKSGSIQDITFQD